MTITHETSIECDGCSLLKTIAGSHKDTPTMWVTVHCADAGRVHLCPACAALALAEFVSPSEEMQTIRRGLANG